MGSGDKSTTLRDPAGNPRAAKILNLDLKWRHWRAVSDREEINTRLVIGI